MKSWLKVKSSQAGSNITQNHSSRLLEVISSHYLPHLLWNDDQKCNPVKFESGRTLLKITHLASRKSYLVIICPTSYEKLTKSEIRSSWNWFEHCSKSLIHPPKSHIWSLFAPIHMKSWPNVKSGKVVVHSNIAWNNSSSLLEVIYGHNLPRFTWNVDQNRN